MYNKKIMTSLLQNKGRPSATIVVRIRKMVIFPLGGLRGDRIDILTDLSTFAVFC